MERKSTMKGWCIVPKSEVPVLGVPIIRARVFWGPLGQFQTLRFRGTSCQRNYCLSS